MRSISARGTRSAGGTSAENAARGRDQVLQPVLVQRPRDDVLGLHDPPVLHAQPQRQQHRPVELLHHADERHLVGGRVGHVESERGRRVRGADPQSLAHVEDARVLGEPDVAGQRRPRRIVRHERREIGVHDAGQAGAVARRQPAPRATARRTAGYTSTGPHAHSHVSRARAVIDRLHTA